VARFGPRFFLALTAASGPATTLLLLYGVGGLADGPSFGVATRLQDSDETTMASAYGLVDRNLGLVEFLWLLDGAVPAHTAWAGVLDRSARALAAEFTQAAVLRGEQTPDKWMVLYLSGSVFHARVHRSRIPRQRRCAVLRVCPCVLAPNPCA